MSSTIIFGVHQNGDVKVHGQAPNAFGGAIWIWEKLKEEYKIPCQVMDYQPLWDALGSLKHDDNWVLAATLDRAVLPKEYITLYIRALEQFAIRYPHQNLTIQIATLTRIARAPRMRGAAWNQTSVNAGERENWQIITGSDKHGDPVTRPYNIDQDTDHWILTAETVSNGKGNE